MKCLLSVSLAALTIVGGFAARNAAQSPALQKGVSVQMAVTHHALPMAEADNEDAWVVAVTAGGDLYFGAEAMTPDQLAEWMRTHPRSREANLYIKADARVSSANLEKVLEIGHAMGFDAPVLLTAQVEPKTPGTMLPPKGLVVLLDAPSDANAIVVSIGRRQNSSTLSVNNTEISADALPRTLQQLIQNSGNHVVMVKADGAVPFGDLAYVIDVCRSVGASAALPKAQL